MKTDCGRPIIARMTLITMAAVVAGMAMLSVGCSSKATTKEQKPKSSNVQGETKSDAPLADFSSGTLMKDLDSAMENRALAWGKERVSFEHAGSYIEGGVVSVAAEYPGNPDDAARQAAAVALACYADPSVDSVIFTSSKKVNTPSSKQIVYVAFERAKTPDAVLAGAQGGEPAEEIYRISTAYMIDPEGYDGAGYSIPSSGAIR